MALGFYFTPSGFPTATYDEVLKRLEDAGAGAPLRRLTASLGRASGRSRCSTSGILRHLSMPSARRWCRLWPSSEPIRAATGFDGAQHHSGLIKNAEKSRGSLAVRSAARAPATDSAESEPGGNRRGRDNSFPRENRSIPHGQQSRSRVLS